VSRKAKSGSHRKVDTGRHRKRRKKELGNRAVKDRERMKAELEFAQRIQEEPSLTERSR